MLRMPHWWMLVLLAGCAADAALPPPGAEGPIVVRQWDATGQRAVVMKARTLRQAGAFTATAKGDQDLDLDGVLVRAPLDEGVFVAASASARYSPKARPTAVLPGPGAPPGSVVAVAGVWQGVPVIGRATRAEYDEQDQSLRLSDLEMCHLGNWTRHQEAVVKADRSIDLHRAYPARRAPLGVVSALAALPERMEIPELTTR
jgi:hypothetical protein